MIDIIESIKNEVISICDEYKSRTGDDEYQHIHSVAAISGELADKYSADKEITLLGAYLHDISSPAEYGNPDDHHIYSAELAEKMLSTHDYPRNRIERVLQCILNHRGSKFKTKDTVEEECVADADAITHLYSIPVLFHVAYVLKSLPQQDGANWVKKKLTNDYNKLSDRTKEAYKDKFIILFQTLFGDTGQIK